MEKIEKIKINEKISLIKRMWNWSMNHFFKTFLIFLMIHAIFIILRNIVPISLAIIPFILLTIYIVSYLLTHIGINIKKLLLHELRFSQILTGYITSVVFIIVLFSILYLSMNALGVGYLKYSQCIGSEEINKDIIANDPLRVEELWHYPYYSAMTFFTAGYGDICPMGISKLVSLLNALIGNAFTVLILAIAITNYSSNKDNGKNKSDKND